MKCTKVAVARKEVIEGEKIVTYELVDIEKYKGVDGESFANHAFIMDEFRKLMGKTLTIIDASIPAKNQNSATKDLIRNMFSDEIGFVSNFTFDQKKIQEMIDDDDIEASYGAKPVGIEEMLGVETKEGD